MSKQTEWVKKHAGLVAVAVIALLLLVVVMYIRGRVKKYNARRAEATLTREPTINPGELSRSYEVDNSNAAAIFGITPGAEVVPAEPAPAPAPAVAPVATAEKPKSQPRNTTTAVPTSAQRGEATPTGGDPAGALAELERREQAAAEKARTEANERIRKAREAQQAAEDRAAALEAEMSKPKFNFTIVQERNEFATIDFPDKTKVTQDREVLYAAKIYGTQRVKSGDPVTLRNTEAINVGKNKMPVGSIIYGIAQQSGNRMHINLSNVQTRDGKFPITGLSICDFDMVKGIYLKEYEDVGQDRASDIVIEDVGSVLPNQLAGSVVNTASKQIQKNINRQQKIVITLEDNYEIYVAVPQK